MKKEFHVTSKSTGEVYEVNFSDETGKVQAHCTCRAGMFGTLCKHIISIMETDSEVQDALKRSGQIKKWDSYLEKEQELEQMKKEVAATKKYFAKDLLYIKR